LGFGPTGFGVRNVRDWGSDYKGLEFGLLLGFGYRNVRIWGSDLKGSGFGLIGFGVRTVRV
jgi:hypothetical protein